MQRPAQPDHRPTCSRPNLVPDLVNRLDCVLSDLGSEPGGQGHGGSEPDDNSDEELDPRVQEELEKLNSCTDEINRLENQLEEATNLFRTLLTDSTHQLKALSKRIGTSSIEKARPYYEALEMANRAQKECQAAATAYQRANGIHAAAKETIALAEQRFLSNSNEWDFDNAWQEMLNHATIKVMEAEKLKTESESEHLARAATFTAAEQALQSLEKKLSRHVQKSQPYFEHKDAFNRALESQKLRVQELQSNVASAKTTYSKSLRNLEEISESIHARRKLKRLLVHHRQPGVGAERSCSTQEAEYDLDRISSRSTTSGQSDDKESGLDEIFPAMTSVTRTTSCPAQMVVLSEEAPE